MFAPQGAVAASRKERRRSVICLPYVTMVSVLTKHNTCIAGADGAADDARDDDEDEWWQ